MSASATQGDHNYLPMSFMLEAVCSQSKMKLLNDLTHCYAVYGLLDNIRYCVQVVVVVVCFTCDVMSAT